MPFGNYVQLQTAILAWLARPGDPKVEPAVPDMIRLFEAEATRRLRLWRGETTARIAVTAGVPDYTLPNGVTRAVWFISGAGDQRLLGYLPLTNSGRIWGTSGAPRFYTISANRISIAPKPAAGGTLAIDYVQELPLLAAPVDTNWLLAGAPDAYLFGSLAEAELYIGHDERAPMWLQRREAAFASLIAQDLKFRWPGPLQIRVDGITAPAGAGGGAGLPEEADMDTVAVVYPASGSAVYMDDYPGVRSLYVATAPSTLTIVLPRDASLGHGEEVEVNFSGPVSTFQFLEIPIGSEGAVVVSGTPTTAYGPGAAIVMRWIGTDGIGWLLWK